MALNRFLTVLTHIESKINEHNSLPDNKIEDNNSQFVGDDKQRQDSDRDRKSLRWMGFGLEFVGVLAIFSYGGWWLDQKMDHEFPWLMMIGFGIGFTGMMYLLYKETTNLRK